MRLDSAVRSIAELLAQQPPRKASEWLTSEEAMKYLNFPSIEAFYQAVRRGQVPVRRIGRRLRFNRAELDSVLGR